MSIFDNARQPDELGLDYDIDRKTDTDKDFKEEHGVHMKVWHPDGTKVLYSFDKEEPSWDDAKFLLNKVGKETQGYEHDVRLLQGLPGTEYYLLMSEEGKLPSEWVINYPATQHWQDMVVERMGYEWLMDHYRGFVHNYDCVAGAAVEIVKGKYEDE